MALKKTRLKRKVLSIKSGTKRAVVGQIKPNKKKSKSLSKYKKEFDAVFSKFIRRRDNHTCYTCGIVMEPTKSQNGHFVPRQYLSLRWDERNCHAQCYACNVLYNGQPSVYAIKLTEQYGPDILREFEAKRKELTKLREDFYIENIGKYKALLEKE